jgi:hypothetical protein
LILYCPGPPIHFSFVLMYWWALPIWNWSIRPISYQSPQGNLIAGGCNQYNPFQSADEFVLLVSIDYTQVLKLHVISPWNHQFKQKSLCAQKVLTIINLNLISWDRILLLFTFSSKPFEILSELLLIALHFSLLLLISHSPPSLLNSYNQLSILNLILIQKTSTHYLNLVKPSPTLSLLCQSPSTYIGSCVWFQFSENEQQPSSSSLG